MNEVNILNAAIANLVDERFGSTAGWNNREVDMISGALDVSPAMAIVMLKACDTVRETNNFDPV